MRTAPPCVRIKLCRYCRAACEQAAGQRTLPCNQEILWKLHAASQSAPNRTCSVRRSSTAAGGAATAGSVDFGKDGHDPRGASRSRPMYGHSQGCGRTRRLGERAVCDLVEPRPACELGRRRPLHEPAEVEVATSRRLRRSTLQSHRIAMPSFRVASARTGAGRGAGRGGAVGLGSVRPPRVLVAAARFGGGQLGRSCAPVHPQIRPRPAAPGTWRGTQAGIRTPPRRRTNHHRAGAAQPCAELTVDRPPLRPAQSGCRAPPTLTA